jgi:hypothetical protein
VVEWCTVCSGRECRKWSRVVVVARCSLPYYCSEAARECDGNDNLFCDPQIGITIHPQVWETDDVHSTLSITTTITTHIIDCDTLWSGPQRRVPRNCDASQLENPRRRPVPFSTVNLTPRRRTALVTRQLDATTPRRRNDAATPQRRRHAATTPQRRNDAATPQRRRHACDPST